MASGIRIFNALDVSSAVIRKNIEEKLKMMDNKLDMFTLEKQKGNTVRKKKNE
jgi:hypothetical protein